MLSNASTIAGYAITATDGNLGTVSDFLFDDSDWFIRWLVVDTGNWLSGRKVLLPTSVLGHLDSDREEFAVRLTMRQVKDSPDIDTDRSVSRRMEASVYDYYGWRPYWGSGLYMGSYGTMGNAIALAPGTTRQEAQDERFQRDDEDPHLRSCNSVTGYHVRARDGEIGHVKDFLLEDADWTIHYVVVDTTNWWAGKKVLISPRSVTGIAWRDSLMNLNVERQAVKDSPLYDATAPVARSYERKFDDYYSGAGRPNSL